VNWFKSVTESADETRETGRMQTMALEQELETYRRNLSGMLDQEQRYVLVQGERVVGFYDLMRDALKAGYEEFGLDPFLVKKVEAVEKPLYYSRNIKPCPT